MQLIYGFSFGFIVVLNKKIRRFCKLITLVICLCNSAALLLCTPVFVSAWDIRAFWGSLYFVQYCGHIILLCFPKYKVYNYITDIRRIDDHNIVHSYEHKIGLFACIVFGCYFVIATMILGVAVCITTNVGCMFDNKYVNLVYMISLIGVEAIVLVQLIVNLYTHIAVIYLVSLVGREEVSFIRKQFLFISECCEKFGKCYGNLVSIYVT